VSIGFPPFGARPLRAAAVTHVAEFSFPRKRQSVVAIVILSFDAALRTRSYPLPYLHRVDI
jgi:hypothetical protein